MTRNELEMSRHIKGEIMDIQENINALEVKREKIKGSVNSSLSRFSFFQKDICGEGSYNDSELEMMIQKHINVLEEKELYLQRLQIEIEDFLSSVEDSYIRRIIRLWCINCLTWNQIAQKLGGTEDSVRKIYTRFFIKK
ncbi:hypothetical protein [Anaeromicropila populeti]|uniref:Sigma-70, region 4 n=1 Tax=Anaeromicropila populeti TaxID=37658 RepID=A0A1I6JHV0_9FIRM|nr:hypothetical protein [Anaeromicropila populeti]SFR78525.1 hypothetical protein SAMN05661086_01701 [Anaeromicropila populeti]